MARAIDEPCTVLASEIASLIQDSRLTEHEILSARQQLISRHSALRLKKAILSEEIVEALFRCRVIDHLVRRFNLDQSALPECINASHKAVRRVCAAIPEHDHLAVLDTQWTAGWTDMQIHHPSVNVRAPGQRSARHADLYVIAGAEVISLEFKYVGKGGLRDVAACLAQVARHADHHEQALFVVYAAPGTRPELNRIRAGLSTNARLVHVEGPAIPAVEGRR